MDNSTIYVSLITLALILTVGLHIIMTTRKEVYIIYTIFKVFFLVLFVLWMNKYFTNRIKKMIKYDEDEPEEDGNFFTNLINKFY